jgi:DNA invertase Pin-like site-specific DNA recombinase
MLQSAAGWRATMKRAAVYVRVSTDRQTVGNQLRELRAIAERRGWEIVATYNDAGVSGAKERDQRPGLDSLLKDAQRRKFDVVMAWAIDRMGRSLVDLLHTIETLQACGVDLYLDQQAIDTTTPAGKLMFAIVGAFAEFERSMTVYRIHSGLKRAREQGKVLGRPAGSTSVDPKKVTAARRLLEEGMGIVKAAKLAGLGVGTVHRIKAQMAQ